MHTLRCIWVCRELTVEVEVEGWAPSGLSLSFEVRVGVQAGSQGSSLLVDLEVRLQRSQFSSQDYRRKLTHANQALTYVYMYQRRSLHVGHADQQESVLMVVCWESRGDSFDRNC